MLVYGLRCDPKELLGLPKKVTADYHVEHRLLVFPRYTRPFVLSANGHIDENFCNELRAILRGQAWMVQREHPFITEDEHEVILALKESNPQIITDWFYLPTPKPENHSH